MSRMDHSGQAAHARYAAALRAGTCGGSPAMRRHSSTLPSTGDPLWRATSRLAVVSATAQGGSSSGLGSPPHTRTGVQDGINTASRGVDDARDVEGGDDDDGECIDLGHLHTQQDERNERCS